MGTKYVRSSNLETSLTVVQSSSIVLNIPHISAEVGYEIGNELKINLRVSPNSKD